MANAEKEYYPIKTAKQKRVFVVRNVAAPPPYGFGVAFSEIKQTLNKFERSEEIVQGPVRVRLYFRHLTSTGGPDCYILLFVSAGRQQVADVALRIYPDLCPNLEEKTPVEIAEAFAEQFGVEFRVGAKTAKFFHRETIPLDADSLDRPVSAAPDQPSSLCLFGRPDGEKYPIALGLCVNTGAYAESINRI